MMIVNEVEPSAIAAASPTPPVLSIGPPIDIQRNPRTE
jgi:hypothetical protein